MIDIVKVAPMLKRMITPLKPSNSSLENSTLRPKAKVNSSAIDTRKVTGAVSGGFRRLALASHAHVMEFEQSMPDLPF